MNRVAVCLLVSVLLLLASGAAIAQDLVRTSGEATDWRCYSDVSAATIGSALDEHVARLIDLEVTSVSPLRFTASMVRNAGTYATAWWWYFGITADRLSELLDELNARITDLEIYSFRGQLRFAVILVPNTGSQAKAWWWYFGASPGDLSNLIVQNNARLVDIEVVEQSGEPWYAAVMIRNTGADQSAWWWYYGLSASDLSDVLSTHSARLYDLERMSDGRYVIIALPEQGETWSWYGGLSGSGAMDRAASSGSRIVDIESYASGGASQYAVVLTQNGEDATAATGEWVREVYPVEIVLTTTSDWTDVRFAGGTLVVRDHEILEGAGASGLQISALSTLSVGQDCCDVTPVRVSFDAFLSNASEWLQVHVEKGYIGQTTIAFHAPGNLDPISAHSHDGVVEDPDPGNTRTFSIRSSSLTSRLTPALVSESTQGTSGGPKVLAFYYPWYGNPSGPSGEWFHWNPYSPHYNSAHVPAAGWYDSQDPDTVRQHIREAKAAGIDGFIASWWGPYGFEDQAFDVLAEVAEEEDFTITIYYEEADTPSEIVSDLAYFLARHESNPALLRVDGRPAVLFYVRVTHRFSLAQWESVLGELESQGHAIFAIADGIRSDFLGVFDGIHTYNPVGLPLEEVAAQYEAASLLARAKDRLFGATVIPGYDEAYKNPALTFVDREGGETYRTYWAIAREVSPHWVLITSFNEWHEGTEIEPSVEFGRTYLEITAEQAAAWKTGEPLPVVEPDRDGDGVPDDVDLCPDFPGEPGMDGC